MCSISEPHPLQEVGPLYAPSSYFASSLMASETFEICKGCFFKYRATEADISTRCSHHARRIGVRWNSAEGWFETTEVRDPPEGWIQWWRGKARLCDPYKGSCRKDDCIYAHGTNELDKWNEMLQLQRKACSRPISKYFH